MKKTYKSALRNLTEAMHDEQSVLLMTSKKQQEGKCYILDVENVSNHQLVTLVNTIFDNSPDVILGINWAEVRARLAQTKEGVDAHETLH